MGIQLVERWCNHYKWVLHHIIQYLSKRYIANSILYTEIQVYSIMYMQVCLGCVIVYIDDDIATTNERGRSAEPSPHV